MIEYLEYIFLIYIGFNVLYIAFFAIAGIFYRQRKFPETNQFSKMLVLMPSYKDNEIVLQAALHNMQQDYPKEAFDLVVLGDQLEDSIYEAFDQNEVQYLKINFAVSTKAKAINYALNTIQKKYNLVVILDADNHLSTNALQKINQAHQAGHKFIQCHRTAKNENTTMAILDAVNEEINNHIFRKGHQAVGISTALIGSGMAFDYNAFKYFMKGLDNEVGEDKILEMRLLDFKEKVIYLNDVLVYDEKIQQMAHFEKQRSRWLLTQWQYFKKYIRALPKAFYTLNISFANKILQTMVLPRSFMLVVTILGLLAFYFIGNFQNIWLGLNGLLVFALLISVPKRFYKFKNLKLLYSIPRAILGMFKALFKIKTKEIDFKPTPHTYQS